MVGIYIQNSKLFYASTGVDSNGQPATAAAKLAMQISNWLSSETKNPYLAKAPKGIPGVKLLERVSESRTLQDSTATDEYQAIFKYAGQPVGVTITSHENLNSKTSRIHLFSNYYIRQDSEGVWKYERCSWAEDTYFGIDCSKFTYTGTGTNTGADTETGTDTESEDTTLPGEDSLEEGEELIQGTTYYTVGVWYGVTPKGGLVLGLWNDDVNAYMKYPVYFGRQQNAFGSGGYGFTSFNNEEYVYAVNLNGGAFPQNNPRQPKPASGTTAHADSLLTGHNVSNLLSTTKYMILNDVGATEKEMEKWDLYLQHIRAIPTNATPYTISYTPLYGVLSSKKWCPVFHIDNFYCGSYSKRTVPPVMGTITVSGTDFTTLTNDGVAVLGTVGTIDDLIRLEQEKEEQEGG